MTFEERLAELGVDLSDLPDEYSMEQCASACIVAGKWAKYTDHTVPFHYILHLVDVIDRMETRLVNVTGELNFIKYAFRDCATCTVGSVPYDDRCNCCDENFSNYEFAGVLENWRPDDD